jgi:hypothetical protein
MTEMETRIGLRHNIGARYGGGKQCIQMTARSPDR